MTEEQLVWCRPGPESWAPGGQFMAWCRVHIEATAPQLTVTGWWYCLGMLVLLFVAVLCLGGRKPVAR